MTIQKKTKSSLIPASELSPSALAYGIQYAIQAGDAAEAARLAPFANLTEPLPDTLPQQLALHLAAREGNVDVIQALLPFCDPSQKTANRTTPLMAAAAHSQIEALRALLPVSDARAQSVNGWTALFCAATQLGDSAAACVRALLPVSDLNARASDGATALHAAATASNLAVLAELIALSDANARANDGRTPLMAAASYGHAENVRALLPVSDPNAKDKDGWTALMWSLGESDNAAECARVLMEASDLDAINNEGHSVFQMAQRQGSIPGMLLAEKERRELNGLLQQAAGSGSRAAPPSSTPSGERHESLDAASGGSSRKPRGARRV